MSRPTAIPPSSASPSSAAPRQEGLKKESDIKDKGDRFRSLLRQKPSNREAKKAAPQKEKDAVSEEPGEGENLSRLKEKKERGEKEVSQNLASADSAAPDEKASAPMKADSASGAGGQARALADHVQKACQRILIARGDGAGDVSMRFTLSSDLLPQTVLNASRAPDGALQMVFESASPESQNFLAQHAAALSRHIQENTGQPVRIEIAAEDGQGIASDSSDSQGGSGEGGGERQGGWSRAEWREDAKRL